MSLEAGNLTIVIPTLRGDLFSAFKFRTIQGLEKTQPKGARGRACLYCTAPLPAPGNRFRSPVLETKNKARGEANVVLRLSSRSPHAESRQQVLCLDGANGKVIKQLVVQTAARSHGKRVLRSS